MTSLQLFVFPDTGQRVRTVVLGDEPWFVAADVARILGYRMASDMTRRLDDDEKDTHSARTPGGAQEMAIISEPGLYVATLGSQVPGAKAFKRWVTHEVLPEIRRTGSYSGAAKPAIPSHPEALRGWAAEIEAREVAEARAALAERRADELEPSAYAWDVLASAHGDFSVREAAFILDRDPSISTGQKRLFATLRDLRLIDSRDIPYAAHERHVALRPRSYDHPRTGEPRLSHQVRITVDGLRYLHRKLGGTAPFDSLIGAAA